jgi:hypothetical protein
MSYWVGFDGAEIWPAEESESSLAGAVNEVKIEMCTYSWRSVPQIPMNFGAI